MPISIYPPTLKSARVPFFYRDSSCPIEFSLSKVASSMAGKVKHIQIRVVDQYDNLSIVKTTLYPDGIIYRNMELSPTVSSYSVNILSSDLSPIWQPGHFYKIQLRFGTTPIFTSISEFATWKRQQIERQTFSEWSTVMITKAIGKPVAEVIEAANITSTSPEFTGSFSIEPDSKEYQTAYKFILYKGSSTDKADQLEESPWLEHGSGEDNPGDKYCFHEALQDKEMYTVDYWARTKNGLEVQAIKPYTFTVSLNFLSVVEGLTLIVDSESNYCQDNGCIDVYVHSTQAISGSFVVIRASEKDGFHKWYDMKFKTYNQERLSDKELILHDFTVESGIKYRYALQQQNRTGLRTTPLYEDRYNLDHFVNFEYAYLYASDIQLKLQFNNTISSFKHTVLTSKQDTLGGKYPHLSKNGQAYYGEFPITGLISLYMDEDQTFFQRKSDGYYYNGKLVIPSDKFLEDSANPESNITFNQDLTHNNIFIERVFREKVEEFLNNFYYKLYKSPTEGNMIVVLQNVTLQPKQELGRMLFSFSATAYEVMENTLENLNATALISVGEFQSLAEMDPTPSFGQIHGLYTGQHTYSKQTERYEVTTPTDLVSYIKGIEEIPIAGGYITRVKKITGLYLEQYPWVDHKAERLELEAKISTLLNNNEDATVYQERLDYYNALQEYLESTPETKNAILQINGQELIMTMGKRYNLDDIELDFIRDDGSYIEQPPNIYLKYTGPIIINYTCELVQDQDYEVGIISNVDQVRIWGQVQGVFTDNPSILRNYNFNYATSETDRLYHLTAKRRNGTYIVEPDPIIVGLYGDTILDNTQMNVYKSLNISNIIKQETKRQVEIANNIPNGFPNYDEEADSWDDGTISYKFESIELLDIETDPGAVISFGKKKDGSDAVEVTVGETGRYILYPAQDLISYVAFKSPHYAIINYKCQTSQMTLG